MLTAIQGIYKDGKVELSETPSCPDGAPVVVTFLEPHKKTPGKMMTFGMFKGPKKTTDKDFEQAEFNSAEALAEWEKANRAD